VNSPPKRGESPGNTQKLARPDELRAELRHNDAVPRANESMTQRLHFLPILLSGLLVACASDPAPAPVDAPPTAPKPMLEPQSQASHLPAVSGQLLGVAAGAEVELALLVVDARGRPGRSLGSQQLRGGGDALPFELHFEPTALQAGQRLELRARVSHSGRLVQRLIPRTIASQSNQSLGELSLVAAP